MTDRSHILAALAGALFSFAALNLFAMSRNFWGFEYPLDDVYIHLAMAEEIARGGYGVNPGEYASAASSPLYPLLLTPFAGSDLQRWLPLFWNILFLATAAVLFGKIMARAAPSILGTAASALGLFALGATTTAYSGMENMGHGAASLMIILGLWHFVETRHVNSLLIIGVFLAPAFRLEGLALSLAAGGTVFLLGNRKSGALLMGLGLLPVVAFVAYLHSLDLGLLPNSVVAKLGTGAGGPMRLIEKFQINTFVPAGRLLLAATLILTLLALAHKKSDPNKAWFAIAVSAAALAHLFVGSIGWMDRYENYILLSVVAAISLTLSQVAPRWTGPGIMLILVAGLVTYSPNIPRVFGWNMRAISDQQGEMARFVKEFAKAPVAVNDLGYVSWQNDFYVLDLWGLASKSALEIRRSDPKPGWAGPLADEHDVRFAMIYEPWIGDALPANWVKLGELKTNVPDAFLGGAIVSFYARDSVESDRLIPLLQDWSKDLPPGNAFNYSGGGE